MELINFAARQQREYDLLTTQAHRRTQGHFGTPPSIAEYMAGLFTKFPQPIVRILDPGAGVGTLSAAVCQRIAGLRGHRSVFIELWENDPTLQKHLAGAMEECKRVLEEQGHRFEYAIETDDFLLGRPRFPLLETTGIPSFHLVIMNPPYFELRKDSDYAKAMRHVVHGQPNIYALFMAAAVDLLLDGGEIVAITPRSYFSGPYFKKFRHWFFERVAPRQIHVFKSRVDAFRDDQVLQENVILLGQKAGAPGDVVLTSSAGRDCNEIQKCTVPYSRVIDETNGDFIVRVTTDRLEQRLLECVDAFPENLRRLGFEISTGPVVHFRATEYLLYQKRADSAPLLWSQNVRPFTVRFPVNMNGKARHIQVCDDSMRLLVPSKRYVLLKRFAAKEERRRLVAAVMEPEDSYAPYVGLENHLNYVYRPKGELTPDEAFGLAALFNSEFIDRYFRAVSGNTQINAAEVRNLPLPELTVISRLGDAVRTGTMDEGIELERLVATALELPEDLVVSLCASKCENQKKQKRF